MSKNKDNDELLRAQINALIHDEIQEGINDYLDAKEAEILVLVKDKDLETKYNVSLDNVKQAYQDIQWGNRS